MRGILPPGLLHVRVQGAAFRTMKDQAAGRNAGVFGQLLEVFRGRKSVSVFPGRHHRDGHAQIGRHLLERDLPVTAPLPQAVCKEVHKISSSCVGVWWHGIRVLGATQFVSVKSQPTAQESNGCLMETLTSEDNGLPQAELVWSGGRLNGAGCAGDESAIDRSAAGESKASLAVA